MNEKELIELYFERDERALSETDAVYGDKLRRLAERFLGSRDDAEECLNDTYFKLWNAIPPHRPDNLYVFAAVICRRTAMNMFTKRTAQRRASQLVELTHEMGECIAAPEAEEKDNLLSGWMNAFLETLDEEKRVVFVRRYWFGESAAEIAKKYGYSETKVRSLLFRTRKKLKEYLNGKGVRL